MNRTDVIEAATKLIKDTGGLNSPILINAEKGGLGDKKLLEEVRSNLENSPIPSKDMSGGMVDDEKQKVKKKLLKSRDQIFDIIQEFENDTGFSVRWIDIRRQGDMPNSTLGWGEGDIVELNITTKLSTTVSTNKKKKTCGANDDPEQPENEDSSEKPEEDDTMSEEEKTPPPAEEGKDTAPPATEGGQEPEKKTEAGKETPPAADPATPTDEPEEEKAEKVDLIEENKKLKAELDTFKRNEFKELLKANDIEVDDEKVNAMSIEDIESFKRMDGVLGNSILKKSQSSSPSHLETPQKDVEANAEKDKDKDKKKSNIKPPIGNLTVNEKGEKVSENEEAKKE